jgi:hypothetical protein
MALVDRYLAIEQVRFGTRLSRTRDQPKRPPVSCRRCSSRSSRTRSNTASQTGPRAVGCPLSRYEAGRLVIALEPVDDDARTPEGEGWDS